jgi:myosin heavy subunit
MGAKLLNYLLEKSRITNQAIKEKNYHIFYLLLAGGNSAMIKELGLEGLEVKDFAYLNKSKPKQ